MLSPSEFPAPAASRAIEYLVAVSYLLLFIPFWRWVNRPMMKKAEAPATEPKPVAAPVPAALPAPAAWFEVPDGLSFHPGHAWARQMPDGRVRVGLDDFAGRLVGPADAVGLPAPGAVLRQGEKGWLLSAGDRAVEMLSPVDGMVTNVNHKLLEDPGLASRDPYGQGWLLELTPARLGANLKQLLSGDAARRWMEGAASVLHGAASAGLGPVAADGGVPVSGIAREIDPEHWERIAEQFFLTD
jgi:glycine cleavage system H lipoate-binding protein